MRLKRNELGFTLAEMLVVISLLGLLTMSAAPKFTELSASFDRMNAKSYIIQDLKRAQAESITEGCRGIFAVDADSNGYSFGCDYLSYDTAVPPSADTISFRRQLPSTVRVTVTAPIIFNSRGHAVDPDDILNNVTINLNNVDGVNFAAGTLLGTGVFTYE